MQATLNPQPFNPTQPQLRYLSTALGHPRASARSHGSAARSPCPAFGRPALISLESVQQEVAVTVRIQGRAGMTGYDENLWLSVSGLIQRLLQPKTYLEI